MKYFELDQEEKELLEEIEKGEWVPVKNQKEERRKAIEAARNTLNKTKNINLRLSEKDLHKLKAKALGEGLPYQTLVSSIIHKLVNS